MLLDIQTSTKLKAKGYRKKPEVGDVYYLGTSADFPPQRFTLVAIDKWEGFWLYGEQAFESITVTDKELERDFVLLPRYDDLLWEHHRLGFHTEQWLLEECLPRLAAIVEKQLEKENG